MKTRNPESGSNFEGERKQSKLRFKNLQELAEEKAAIEDALGHTPETDLERRKVVRGDLGDNFQPEAAKEIPKNQKVASEAGPEDNTLTGRGEPMTTEEMNERAVKNIEVSDDQEKKVAEEALQRAYLSDSEGLAQQDDGGVKSEKLSGKENSDIFPEFDKTKHGPEEKASTETSSEDEEIARILKSLKIDPDNRAGWNMFNETDRGVETGEGKKLSDEEMQKEPEIEKIYAEKESKLQEEINKKLEAISSEDKKANLFKGFLLEKLGYEVKDIRGLSKFFGKVKEKVYEKATGKPIADEKTKKSLEFGPGWSPFRGWSVSKEEARQDSATSFLKGELEKLLKEEAKKEWENQKAQKEAEKKEEEMKIFNYSSRVVGDNFGKETWDSAVTKTKEDYQEKIKKEEDQRNWREGFKSVSRIIHRATEAENAKIRAAEPSLEVDKNETVADQGKSKAENKSLKSVENENPADKKEAKRVEKIKEEIPGWLRKGLENIKKGRSLEKTDELEKFLKEYGLTEIEVGKLKSSDAWKEARKIVGKINKEKLGKPEISDSKKQENIKKYEKTYKFFNDFSSAQKEDKNEWKYKDEKGKEKSIEVRFKDVLEDIGHGEIARAKRIIQKMIEIQQKSKALGFEKNVEKLTKILSEIG